MARELNLFQRTKLASADLSASQFCGVVLTTTKDNIALAGAGAAIYGVLQNKPTSGQEATVRVHGVTKMVAGGTVTTGDKVMVNASGQAVTATTTNFVVGYAEDGGTVGAIITVVLLPGGKI